MLGRAICGTPSAEFTVAPIPQASQTHPGSGGATCPAPCSPAKLTHERNHHGSGGPPGGSAAEPCCPGPAEPACLSRAGTFCPTRTEEGVGSRWEGSC